MTVAAHPNDEINRLNAKVAAFRFNRDRAEATLHEAHVACNLAMENLRNAENELLAFMRSQQDRLIAQHKEEEDGTD